MPAAKTSREGAREPVRRDRLVEMAAGEVGDDWLRVASRDCCEVERRAESMGSGSWVVGGFVADVVVD